MQDERRGFGETSPRRPRTNGSNSHRANGKHAASPIRPVRFDEVAEEPIDLVAVQADDELISALAAGMSVSAPGVGGYDADDQVAALLASWRNEVDSEPLPELVDLDTAMATLQAASRPPGRRARHLFPLAAAAAMIVFTIGGVSVGAADARPGDTLWGVSRVLYSERAESVEAAQRVEVRINEAKDALSRGEPEVAAQALAAAEEDLVGVRAEEGLAELAEVQSFLEAKAAETPKGQPIQPGTPLASDPRRPVPPGAATETSPTAASQPAPAVTSDPGTSPAPAVGPETSTTTGPVTPTSDPSTADPAIPPGNGEGSQDPPTPTAEGSADLPPSGQGLGPTTTADGTPTAAGAESGTPAS
ncbi:anti-sigma-D factor RsdA [Pseudonocardia saturnea]